MEAKNEKLDLIGIRLSYGAHEAREEGVCLMEAVAWFAGEKHSDVPACVSPVLASMGRSLNDRLLGVYGRPEYEPRLRALIPRLAGTADRPDLDAKAALMAEDFLVRQVIPVLFRKTNSKDLRDYAEKFEALPEITSWKQVPVGDLRAAIDAAYAARSTASADYAARAIAARADATYATAYAADAVRADTGLHEEVVSLFERMIDLWAEG